MQEYQKPRKCVNFEICGCDDLPIDWETSRGGKFVCINCDYMFGILKILENADCPVCLEENQRSVVQLRCDHSVCIRCFVRMHYGTGEDGLPFPLPDIEEEYFTDRESDPQLNNPKWDDSREIILQWETDDMKFFDHYEINREKELNYITLCPLCRL